MATRVQVAQVQKAPPAPGWRPATRVAFRFCFVYFGLYALLTQVFGGIFLFPGFAFPALGRVWPVREFTIWSAERLFGITTPLVYVGTSGDTIFHWIQEFWLLVTAVLATAIWSALDRGRESYVTLHKWFRLFVRFALAAQMFYYGMAKVIPTQFPAPSLVTLVEPVGNLSLTDMLWTSIGSSTAYQIFTGCAEMLGGLLLLTPFTTTLGAMIVLADMTQVFVLNMTYDFGLKQISFHLILLSLFLLTPDLRRLANVFFLNRAAEPATQPPLFRTPRANRIALIAQVAFGVYLIGMFTNLTLGYWYGEGGGGYPKSPLYGIWDVQELSVDGQVRPPLYNDYDRRWRRVIFDAPNLVVFQRTDDSFAHYGASIDVSHQILSVTKGNSRSWRSTFTFQRPAPDRLILEGEMDGHRIALRLQRVELDTFRLLNSPFRWIRPPGPLGG